MFLLLTLALQPEVAFSQDNPVQTLRWMHHLYQPVLQAKGNGLAEKDAKMAFAKEMTKCRGKQIRWVTKVKEVRTRDGLTFISLEGYQLPGTGDKSNPPVTLQFDDMLVMKSMEKAIAKLRPGEEVTVNAAIFGLGGDGRKFSIALNNEKTTFTQVSSKHKP